MSNRPAQAVRFKGRSFFALTITPEAPLADWLGRLDGWLVFSNGKGTNTLRVWALCVPTTSIPVEVTNY